MRRIKVVQIGIGHDHGPGALVAMKDHPEVFDLQGIVIPEHEKAILGEYYDTALIPAALRFMSEVASHYAALVESYKAN